MDLSEEVRRLKIKLCSLLLSKDQKELTNNEVDIMFYLAKDEAIKECLNRKKGR